MEAGDFVVQGLVAAIRCEGLDHSVHNFYSSLPACVSELCPLWLRLSYPLPPVICLCALLEPPQLPQTEVFIVPTPTPSLWQSALNHIACPYTHRKKQRSYNTKSRMSGSTVRGEEPLYLWE